MGYEKKRNRQTQDYLKARITLIPRGYTFAFFCVLLAVAAIGTWAVVGKVPIKTSGRGLIVEADRQLFTVQSESNGRVKDIMVATGDKVGHGDVIAELDQSDLEIQIVAAKSAVQDLETNFQALKTRSARKISRHEEAYADMQKVYSGSVKELTESRDLLKQLLDDEEKIEQEGLVTRSNLLANRQSYVSTVVQLADLQTKLADARQSLSELKIDAADKIAAAEEVLNAAKRTLTELKASRFAGRSILAPSAGRIEEIRIAKGQNVTASTVVMTMSKGDDGFELIAFLGPREARRVEIEMPVHVVPLSVSKAEFGTMRGTVAALSSAPLSQAAANVLFRDEQLTQRLMADGETYLMRIRLEADQNTKSGFKWWSGEGPPFAITAGTQADVEVVLAERPPVALIVPAVREFLGF